MKLAILLSSGLLVTSPILSTTPKVMQTNSVNHTQSYIESILKTLNKEINQTNQATIKKLFLNSLVKRDNVLSVDSNKIKQIHNQNLESIFLSKEFAILLHQLDVNQEIAFKNNAFNFTQQILTTTPGLWIETYWYWFGYCKLHLDEELTNKFASAFDEGNVYDHVIKLIPELSAIALTLVPFLTLAGGSDYVRKCDTYHAGIFIGTWAFTTWDGPWADSIS